MYIPKGFKNPYTECVDCKYNPVDCGMEYCEGDKAEYAVWEASAAAYEDALKGEAFEMICGGQKIGYWPARPAGEDGYLVFIPNKEE